MSKVYEELQNHSLEISIQTRLVLALEDEVRVPLAVFACAL